MRVKCDQPGCKYVAKHAQELTAKAMVGRHKRKEHGIVSPGAKYRLAAKEAADGGVAPARKSYTRKVQSSPNFCPGCGCNLRAVSAAMNLGGMR